MAKIAAKPIGIFSGLALLVLLPMLLPGYILTLDMVFTPKLRMPAEVSSSYLFHAALHVLNLIIPSQVIQKAMLFAILFLSGFGVYRLVRFLGGSKHQLDEWGAYFAGALYMINPYTYSRFMAGQYAVLLGYALLPFFVQTSLRFFAAPTLRQTLLVTAWAIGISIVSVHSIGLMVIVLIAELGLACWRQRHDMPQMMPIVKYGLIGLVVFLIASSYWLAPLLTGSNAQGRAIAGFNAGDQQAFAAVGGSAAKRISNVLQLRGFWAEGQNLYLLPQNRLPGWPLVMLAIWALVVIGAIALWRRHQRGMVLLFAVSGLAAVLLAATGLGAWTSAHVPLFAGYREPQKFAGLLALSFAVFVGTGASALLKKTQARQTLFSCLAIGVLLLSILYTPVMFWGFAGQLKPRQYPADWFVMNAELNNDKSDFRALFLPWHLYMSYGFADRIIASPAQDFFDHTVVASNELQFMHASPTAPDAQKSLLSDNVLPEAPKGNRLGGQLAALHVKYVLLAKEYDYRSYDYLDHQTDLTLVRETPHLKLYKVVIHE